MEHQYQAFEKSASSARWRPFRAIHFVYLLALTPILLVWSLSASLFSSLHSSRATLSDQKREAVNLALFRHYRLCYYLSLKTCPETKVYPLKYRLIRSDIYGLIFRPTTLLQAKRDCSLTLHNAKAMSIQSVRTAAVLCAHRSSYKTSFPAA
ncbi:hypothetical protein BDR22DRAFT_271749 [Usnea florida]